jgi:hypothetical protein
MCAEIAPQNQKRFLNPTIRAMADFVKWRDNVSVSEGPLSTLLTFFDQSFSHGVEKLQKMASEKLILPDPFLTNSWEEFISAVNKALDQKFLHVVSHNDTEFWCEAMEDPRSPAALYVKPLAQFAGEKIRLWILPRQFVEDRNETAKTIAGHMKSMGFRVYLVYDEDLPSGIQRDFSIVGNLCISRWLKLGHRNRELEESFSEADKQERLEDWRRLWNLRVYEFE